MNWKKAAALPILASLAIAGCSGGAASDEHAHDSRHAANGDLQEATASFETLPSFLDEQPQAIRNAYLIAGHSIDVLASIPCYCGCGESAGHRSNLNCFVAEAKEDGAVVWDDHGTRCAVCIEIAVEAAVLKKEGLSLKEIRETIDAKYADAGYPAPTPTPLPM
ncbi:hypothetical protein FE782_17555 [Paenibacillus antri]|uniref:Lipoprotein n=1 Tax=Paenibacillus antri TaxID=2582848 RepID=A0A5R9G3C7_9BACL|nr:PCYCGC motif-containing (lipo)protein [Paenibacillus antri]TLS50857.1 hypothetical protein FE782_17555 [Paenibacillus antri]